MNSTAGTESQARRNFNDVWIAIGLSTGAAVSLGFSRFAYALLLPAMRTSLHWNYVQAGGMNTSNAVGYVFGSATAAWFSERMGIKVAFLVTMAVSGGVLLVTGLTPDYTALMVLRFLGGVATAITFVLGASLAAGVNSTGTPQRAAIPLALYITGVGSGIVVSGLVVHAVRCRYVSYMTFIIVLIRNSGGGTGVAAAFWIVLGLCSVMGTLAWGRLLPKLGIRMSSPVVAIVVLLGTLPVLIWPTVVAAFISAVIFGASFMAGPTAVTVIVRKLLRQQTWTAALAALTVAFAIGQAIGPLMSGVGSDATGSVSAGLWLSPVLLIVAAFFALFQRNR